MPAPDRSELTDVKRKIRALAEKTIERGATEAEAMLAMKKMGDLLTQFNLSMDQVTLRDEPCVTKDFSTGLKRRNILWNVFGGMQKFLGVRVWYTRYGGDGIKWSFFGLESDVDMAIYLCKFLTQSETTAADEFKKHDSYVNFVPPYPGAARSFLLNNFKLGFGERINLRLHELARERVAAEKAAAKFHEAQMASKMVPASDEAKVAAAEAKTGTALICVAKEKMIEEEFAKRGPKLRTVSMSNTGWTHSGARNAGRAAGDRVNLSRPLGGGTKTSGYLS